MVRARVLLGCLVAAVALAGCTVGPTPARPSGDASHPVPGRSAPTSSRTPPSANASRTDTGASDPCPTGGPRVDLGSSGFDVPPRLVPLAAGRYQLTATGFVHGGLFDPGVGRTIVVWGHSSNMPTYVPGPATVTAGVGSTVVVEGADTWVDLPEGPLWFLNSNGAHLHLVGCPPAPTTTS